MTPEAVPTAIGAVEAAQTRPHRFAAPRRRMAVIAAAALAGVLAVAAGGAALGRDDRAPVVGDAGAAARVLAARGRAELAAGRTTAAHALLTEAYRLGDTSPTALDGLRASRAAEAARTRRLDGQPGAGPVRALVPSPDGAALLVLRDRGIDAWSLATPAAAAPDDRRAWLALAGEYVAGAVWTRDATRVIAWSPDGIVRLWDPATGTLVETLQAGIGAIAGVELSADGRYAITIEPDGTRRRFDLRAPGGVLAVERGAPVATPPRTAVTPVGVPDRWTAYLDADGAVRLVAAPRAP